MLLLILSLLLDIGVNIYILLYHPTLTLGDLHLDYFWLIVLFNAALIVIIDIVDYIIVKIQRLRIDLEIGEGLADLHKHEH